MFAVSLRLVALLAIAKRQKTYVPNTSVSFVSKASIENGTIATYGLKKMVKAVESCRKIGKQDMKYNDSMPRMKVNPETYVCLLRSILVNKGASWPILQVVEADGMVCAAAPATELPLTQAYYVFWIVKSYRCVSIKRSYVRTITSFVWRLHNVMIFTSISPRSILMSRATELQVQSTCFVWLLELATVSRLIAEDFFMNT